MENTLLLTDSEIPKNIINRINDIMEKISPEAYEDLENLINCICYYYIDRDIIMKLEEQPSVH